MNHHEPFSVQGSDILGMQKIFMLTLDCFCSLSWDQLDEFGEVGRQFQERLVHSSELGKIGGQLHAP